MKCVINSFHMCQSANKIQNHHNNNQPSQRRRRKDEFFDDQMTMAIKLAVILPISISLWVISYVLNSKPEPTNIPSPMRWLVSVLTPLLIAHWGLKRKSIDWSGAISGFIVGFLLTLPNYCFCVSVLTFYLSSSKATKYKVKQKLQFEPTNNANKEFGQRNWVQVICNGGIAAEFSLLYLIERGNAGEIPINFQSDYDSSWWAISVLAALACGNGDTWASELGTVLSVDNPRLITSLRRVPKGTNGGISLIGLIVSALGGLAVGFAYYLCLLICVNRDLLSKSPAQWPIIIVGLLAGLIGSMIDSLLGATFQYSGIDVKTRKIVENPGDIQGRVQHISGINLLDNHSVNLLSTLITALIFPRIAISFWEYMN